MQQQGTVVPITQADLPSLAGVWNGWAYAGANGFPGELTLRPDGYFNNSVGAFTSTGTFQLQNGSLVATPYVSGGLSNADASITVQLIVKNGQRSSPARERATAARTPSSTPGASQPSLAMSAG